MVDMLPFPRVTETTPEKQIVELVNYLIHFKETLEFALGNIALENLSPELINKLNELGANIEQNTIDRDDALAQISSNNVLSVFDVCNSEAFKASVKSEVADKVSGITFSVNFDTGYLEYTM